MSTFAALAAKPGVGAAYIVSVESTTGGTTTVVARWATVSCLIGGYNYDGRILSVGNVTRAFGVERGMAAATVALTLDNADAGLDALSDRTTFGAWRRCTYRLSMVLYDPAAPADSATQLLGLFVPLDMPTRSTESIVLSMSDKTARDAAELKRAPSLSDWAAITEATSAHAAAVVGPSYAYANKQLSWSQPAPIVVSSELVPITLFSEQFFVVAAVAQDRAISPALTVSELVCEGPSGPVQVPLGAWATFARSENITLDGVTWHLIIATISFAPYAAAKMWLKANLPDVFARMNNGVPGDNYLQGVQFSLRSETLSATNGMQTRRPADVALELLTHYSGLTVAQVDATSFHAASLRGPWLVASGTLDISGSTANNNGVLSFETTGGALGKALGDLATLGRFEIVAGSDGTVRAKALLADFAAVTTTPTPIDDTLMVDVGERIPSKGERFEPWSDLYVTVRGQRFGPFQSARRLADLGGQVSKSVSCDWIGPFAHAPDLLPQWMDAHQVAQGFLSDPIAVRPILHFRTSLEAVTLELGDFINASWTRGGRGTPYVSARWRVESWTLQSENGCVDIEAVWCADIDDTTRRPYLLDDEALLVRVAGGTGGFLDLDLTPGSGAISFTGSGNLTTAGVAAGDILVMRDSLEASTSFKTNQAFRIVSVDSTTQATVSPVVPVGAHVTLLPADWTIYRGATTYPTAGTDPTNYPGGGAMYGKVARSGTPGTYSNNSAANMLLNG